MDDVPGLAMVQHNLGRVLMKQGLLDKAEEAENTALDVFCKLGDRLGQIRALGHLGLINEKRGNFHATLEHMNQVQLLAEEIGDMDSLEQGLVDAGRMYLLIQQPDGALLLLKRALDLSLKRGNKEHECRIREILGECHAALDNADDAYVQARKALELQRQLFDRKQQKELAELQVRHELEDARKERQLYQLRNEQLETMAKQRADELASMALSLVRKSELIESLKKQVRDSLLDAHENFQEIVDKIFEAADRRDTSNDWALFEQRLSETQSGFVRDIVLRFPDLTPNELRICSLVRIGLSSREIGGVMSISERSVEGYRLSLRKKMRLKKGQDLAQFVLEFKPEDNENEQIEDDPRLTALLAERFPDVSETEMKVCRLIRGNLSTKEIAEFLSLSERTVETHRYNIRKKLSVPKGQNLNAWLAAL